MSAVSSMEDDGCVIKDDLYCKYIERVRRRSCNMVGEESSPVEI